MTKRKRNTVDLSILVLTNLALLSGCASIVTKPEINSVRKVALVSVYANDIFPRADGMGAVEDLDSETKGKIGTLAYTAFVEEFKKLHWQVMPMQDVVNNDFYKREFAKSDVTSNMSEETQGVVSMLHRVGSVVRDLSNHYINPPGMRETDWPQPSQHEKGQSMHHSGGAYGRHQASPEQLLASLARELKVDAVITVSNDVCYEGAVEVLMHKGNLTMTMGNSKGRGDPHADYARFDVASVVRAVTPDGKMVIKMIDGKRCERQYRGYSDTLLAMMDGRVVMGAGDMIAGKMGDDVRKATRMVSAVSGTSNSLSYTGGLVKAVDEATKRSAVQAVDRIRKAMMD